MKRLLLLSTIISFCLSVSSQSEYKIEFDLNNFSFTYEDSVLVISTLAGDPRGALNPNAPDLPYFPIRILRPESCKVTDFKCEYKEKLIYSNIRMYTTPRIVPTDKDVLETGRPISSVGIDTPIAFCKDVELQGYNYAYFNITPFLYDYQSGNLFFVSEITIKFDDTNNVQLNKNPVDKLYGNSALLKQMVINPDEMSSFYPDSQSTLYKKASANAETSGEDVVDYLIVTNESLAESFKDLISWKIKKGLHAKIITMEDIRQQYSGSDALRLKLCLYDYYQHHQLKWVMLGGDDTIVPVQKCIGSVTDDKLAPADLFFACFKGTFNWDLDGDGIVGEVGDGVNMEPDIYLTRLPVRSTSDVTAFVNKLLKYEQSPETDGYLNTMLLTGCMTYYKIGANSDSHAMSEDMYTNYIQDYWDGDRYYFYDTGNNISSGNVSYNSLNLSDQLNLGYHFVHMACHGDTKSWVLSGDVFNCTSAGSLTNTNSTIIATIACSTNAFDIAEPCLSESFIRNPNGGALAYFGSSREGWGYGEGDALMGPSLSYDSQFFKSLFTGMPMSDPYHFGSVAATAKALHIEDCSQYGSFRWLQLFINPIGDPEMPIYTGIPQYFENASVVDDGSNVTVSSGNVPDCTITLSSADDGETYMKSVKDVSSYTFSNIDFPFYVTITHSDYVPFVSENPLNYSSEDILGQSTICDSVVYSIDKLHRGLEVEWSLSDDFYSQNLFFTNTPEDNQCKIIKHSSISMHQGTLSAKVLYKGNVVSSLSKKVYAHVGSITATCNQSGVVRTITGPVVQVETGQMAVIASKYFLGKSISYSGGSLSFWKTMGEAVLLTFPEGATDPITITATSDAGCGDFSLRVFPVASLYSFALLPEGDKLTISIQGDNDCKISSLSVAELRSNIDDVLSWSLEIVNTITGERMVRLNSSKLNETIDTSTWSSGIYAVKATMNGNSWEKKIQIK